MDAAVAREEPSRSDEAALSGWEAAAGALPMAPRDGQQLSTTSASSSAYRCCCCCCRRCGWPLSEAVHPAPFFGREGGCFMPARARPTTTTPGSAPCADPLGPAHD